MDRMNKQFYSGLFAALTVCSLMLPQIIMADEGDVPEYSASPSATQKSAPISNARCAIKVTNGVKAKGATDVTFIMKGTVGDKNILNYSYDFGDGEVASGGPEISHHYRQAGNYTVVSTPVIDPAQEKEACKTAITIKTGVTQVHQAECISLELLSGNSWTIEQTSKMKILGSDNKGNLQGYRIEAGDQSWEQSVADFEIQLASAGAYLIKAFVKDSTGSWVGGTDNCVRQVKVNQSSLTTQPETGPGNQYWLSLGFLSILWVGVMVWRRYQHLQIG